MRKIIPISFLMFFITIAPTLAAQTTINICYDIVPFLNSYTTNYSTDYYNTIFSNDTGNDNDYTRACKFDSDSASYYYECSPLSQQSCDLSSETPCTPKTFDTVYNELKLKTTSDEQIKISDGFTSMHWEVRINNRDPLELVTTNTQEAYKCLYNQDTNCRNYVLPVSVTEDIKDIIKSKNLDDIDEECGLILTPVFESNGLKDENYRVPNPNCPIGYYCNSGNGKITQCPPLQTTDKPGAKNKTDCKMKSGEQTIRLIDDTGDNRNIKLTF